MFKVALISVAAIKHGLQLRSMCQGMTSVPFFVGSQTEPSCSCCCLTEALWFARLLMDKFDSE